ncbi:DUF3592 domain-containing protein [Alteromonas lipolytica]|uniref:DUF3592 domain-containing protein n=1 Tax=Alteromonas lipolytica TaxID=1856405 RepID=A0A1E8FJX2_9ALTE|nr:DUF3592 domain-containing protein [Alteromonas lipolytica]OFI36230.1 hypothetical protein BFC17_08910 [Alteromonas lipolytica]GGF78977.1 hypothetical protein GCM10011338_34140 [Alteromonas lipolytica]
MATAQKRKYLKMTLATAWICVLTMLLLSWQVIAGFVSGHYTTGEVVDKQVYIEHIRGVGAPRESELHEVSVQYQVNGQVYQVLANAHVYSGLGLIEQGSELTVVYAADNPAQAQVLSYALYSPMVSILGYVAFISFLVGIPRWWLWRNKPVAPE